MSFLRRSNELIGYYYVPRGPCPWLVANTPGWFFFLPFFPTTSTVRATSGAYAGLGAFVILPDAHALAVSRAAYQAWACVQVS